MNILDFVWNYIVVFLFVLTILVFVHEMGHFLVARRNGVRVDVFSIGFGKEIYGWTDRLGTRWKISLIPLGGYVKMFGEQDLDDDDGEGAALTPDEQAVSFAGKSVGQRTAIVAAGPIANFLLAMVLLAGLFGTVGSPKPLAGVGSVQPDSAAAAADIRPGDRILAINDEEVVTFEDLRRIISVNAEVPLTVVVRRGDGETAIAVTPKRRRVENPDGTFSEIGLLGVTPDLDQVLYERHDPLSAAWMGITRTLSLTGQTLSYLGQIIVGARGTDDLGGPLRIAQISGQMAQGGAVNLVYFMAFLSINLGLINLFPIPVLDGGHLAFYLVEAIRGRPLGPRIREYGFRFGLTLVLLLFLFVTWNDLGHLKVFEFIKNFIT